MRPLGSAWPHLRRQLQAARHVCLFLDFDGTLAPIGDHPSHVRLPISTRTLLQQLANQSKVSLVFISGRRLSELKRLIRIRQACYAGNHGLELEDRGVRHVDPVARKLRPVLRQIAKKLRAHLRGVSGVWVEDKGLTLSLHVRQATVEDRARAQQTVATIVGPYAQKRQARVVAGKMIWEIRPATRRDKGSALRRLARRHVGSRPLVIYIGDDHTDEDAFLATERLNGLAILVGRPRKTTAASYWVWGHHAVHAWLQQLHDELQDSGKPRRSETSK